MYDNFDNPETILFRVTVSDVQDVAEEELDRELTEDENYSVKKGIEAGLGDWYEIVCCAIDNLEE